MVPEPRRLFRMPSAGPDQDEAPAPTVEERGERAASRTMRRLARRAALADYGAFADNVGRYAAAPTERLRAMQEAATLTGQWIAAVLLPIVIIIQWALIEAAASVFASIFGVTDYGTHTGIVGGIVAVISLIMEIVAMYSWFLWVRTGGFGIFVIH